MGAMCCRGDNQVREVNARINKVLEEARHQPSIKVLLLGTGESGKSTVMKQMQILYDKGFSDVEKDSFRVVLRRNTFESMQTLVTKAAESGYQWPSPDLADGAELLAGWDSSQQFWTDDVLKLIRLFWANSEIRSWCLRRSDHPPFQLIDSAAYLFDNVARIWSQEYVPTETDILRARLRTSGVVERVIKQDGDAPFRFVDVGGQKNERRKWISCFDDVTAMIYVCAVSEYDSPMFEDGRTNRLADSLAVFRTLMHPPAHPAPPAAHGRDMDSDVKQAAASSRPKPAPFFGDRTAIIVFLNKIDILEDKIQRSPLHKHFPDYQGPEKDYGKAMDFFEDQFLRRAGRRSLYVHATCATDTQAFQKVFVACKKIITQSQLQDMGLFTDD